jgi:hypothetical protein
MDQEYASSMESSSENEEDLNLKYVLPKHIQDKLHLPSSKRVKVTIKPSDSYGPVSLPEGYMEFLAAKEAPKQSFIIPLSYQERKRILEEKRAYVGPQDSKSSKIIAMRAAGGEVWEDSSLAIWDSGRFVVIQRILDFLLVILEMKLMMNCSPDHLPNTLRLSERMLLETKRQVAQKAMDLSALGIRMIL